MSTIQKWNIEISKCLNTFTLQWIMSDKRQLMPLVTCKRTMKVSRPSTTKVWQNRWAAVLFFFLVATQCINLILGKHIIQSCITEMTGLRTQLRRKANARLAFFKLKFRLCQPQFEEHFKILTIIAQFSSKSQLFYPLERILGYCWWDSDWVLLGSPAAQRSGWYYCDLE